MKLDLYFFDESYKNNIVFIKIFNFHFIVEMKRKYDNSRSNSAEFLRS